MENENFFSTVKDMVQDYAEERLLLLRLQATEKAAKASSTLFIGAIVAAVSLVIFLIVSGIAGYYLSQAVGSYNAFVGSLEGNVLPKARRFTEMGVEKGKKPVAAVGVVDAAVRAVAARELLPPPDVANLPAPAADAAE